MLEGKKVLIFDMDGTLIDSVGVWNDVDRALIQKIRTGSGSAPEDVQQQRDEALRRFSKDPNPYLSYCSFLGEKYGSPLSPEDIHTLRYDIAQDFLKHVIDYKPDADVFLHRAKAAGYTLVIATTTKRANMDIYRTQNTNMTAKAKIDDLFTLVYTREDAKEIKPNPEIYLRVMSELGAAPEECLVFEDSLIGIEAAKNAGIPSAAVYDSYSDGERDQINALADYRISSYTQLLESEELQRGPSGDL